MNLVEAEAHLKAAQGALQTTQLQWQTAKLTASTIRDQEEGAVEQWGTALWQGDLSQSFMDNWDRMEDHTQRRTDAEAEVARLYGQMCEIAAEVRRYWALVRQLKGLG